MADVSPEMLARVRACRAPRDGNLAAAATRSSCRSTRRPIACCRSSRPSGASLVSLNPIRDTLEDFFMQRVAEAGDGRAPAPGRGDPCAPLGRSRSTSSASRCATASPTTSSLFAVLLIASSYLLGQLTAGQDVKIIKDLGLAATSVFGLFIAIFIGIGLVSKEVERRSIYALLSKPVSRSQFIAGKYAGLVLTLAVNVAVMSIALYVVLAYMVVDRRRRRYAPDGTRRGRSGAAEGDLPDLRRADARHRARAVLLDLLDADSLGRADLRLLRRRPFQRRPEELRRSSTRSAAMLARARGLPRAARSVRVRREDRGRPRTAGHGGVSREHRRPTVSLYVAGLLLVATFIFSRRDFK